MSDRMEEGSSGIIPVLGHHGSILLFDRKKDYLPLFDLYWLSISVISCIGNLSKMYS